jgi:mRNA interferase YafQ
MLEPIYTGVFNQDLKLMEKRRINDTELGEVMKRIVNEQPLPSRCRPHLLHGKKYEGKWECHVENDWLLIYKISPESHTVTFYRTGTHSDLFKK